MNYHYRKQNEQKTEYIKRRTLLSARDLITALLSLGILLTGCSSLNPHGSIKSTPNPLENPWDELTDDWHASWDSLTDNWHDTWDEISHKFDK